MLIRGKGSTRPLPSVPAACVGAAQHKSAAAQRNTSPNPSCSAQRAERRADPTYTNSSTNSQGAVRVSWTRALNATAYTVCMYTHPGGPCQPKTCPAIDGGCQADCTGRLMNPLHASAAVTTRMAHECMHAHTQHAVLKGGETVKASSGRLLRPTHVHQVHNHMRCCAEKTPTPPLLHSAATAVTVNHAQHTHTHSPCNQPPAFSSISPSSPSPTAAPQLPAVPASPHTALSARRLFPCRTCSPAPTPPSLTAKAMDYPCHLIPSTSVSRYNNSNGSPCITALGPDSAHQSHQSHRPHHATPNNPKVHTGRGTYTFGHCRLAPDRHSQVSRGEGSCSPDRSLWGSHCGITLQASSTYNNSGPHREMGQALELSAPPTETGAPLTHPHSDQIRSIRLLKQS